MSLVWIDCIRRLKEEAQDAAKEEREKVQKQQLQLRKQKAKLVDSVTSGDSSRTTSNQKARKVSFNSIVHVIRFFMFFIHVCDILFRQSRK